VADDVVAWFGHCICEDDGKGAKED
jgi:hypothetical protein